MGSDGSVPNTNNQNTNPNAGAANNQNANPNAGAAVKRPAGPVGGQPPIKTTPASYQPQQRSVLSSRPGVGNTDKYFARVKAEKAAKKEGDIFDAKKEAYKPSE